MNKKETDGIVVKTAKQKSNSMRKVEFILYAEPDKEVSIAGSFNDWTPNASLMTYDPALKAYSIVMDLAPGYYEYKFVVDGSWILDESNPNFAANDFGTLNSVLALD